MMHMYHTVGLSCTAIQSSGSVLCVALQSPLLLIRILAFQTYLDPYCLGYIC